MTCYISHKLHGKMRALTAFLLGLAMLTKAMACESLSTPGMAVANSQLVARLHLDTNSHPRWGQFSPQNSQLILLDVDGQGLVVSLPAGTIRKVPAGLLPVGWLRSLIVARDNKGHFRLLGPVDLTPAKTMTVGELSLPWPFGKGRRLLFDVALSETASAGFLPRSQDAVINENSLVANVTRAGLSINAKNGGREVVDPSGTIVFRGDKKIYGIMLSPDGHKLIVYFGNTDYVLVNRLTGRATKLPATIEEWNWLPDSSTLLGHVSISPADPSHEVVTGTELYLFEPAGKRCRRIKVPFEFRDAALRVLNVSRSGEVLVEAERVVPEFVYLGLFVFGIVW